ncbi:MAG: alpha/beta fold hydrolase [Verrucomicrobiae bacterium]|nr:alpha/beta fold hydrolase [Verrucomicrobiae bacterium]
MAITIRRLLKHAALAFAYGALGVLVVGVFGYVRYLRGRPDLKPWHTAALSEEYRVSSSRSATNFNGYLAQEERLFSELMREVTDRTPPKEQERWSRYWTGSGADPARGGTNWNRTFVLGPSNPRGGVLLLHGLSDGPYSLRALGQRLAGEGFLVMGLRLPGHGTAPASLTRATMEDFAGATRLAARHLRERLGTNLPLVLVGYSNGAALAIEYALARLEGETLPAADGLVLLSPAIGVSPAAALAPLIRGLSRLPGMEKAAWTDIGPEYDPYKYNSFPINAGEQVYRLTRRIQDRLARLDHGAGVAGMPPVLAFQSVVDSTIVPTAIVDRLFRRLAPEGHELVLFDIRRTAVATSLMIAHPEGFTQRLMEDRTAPFSVRLLTTEGPDSDQVRLLFRAAGETHVTEQAVPFRWPPGLMSLSHVALPIPPWDPVYGDGSGAEPGRMQLGDLALRGENGLLLVPPGAQLRLRYNPFYSILEDRVVKFVTGLPISSGE